MHMERSDRFHKPVRPVMVDRFQPVRPVMVDRFQPVRLESQLVRPVLVLWWRISRLLNQLLVYLLFRLILAEQMDLLVIVFLQTLL
jgi:hypothetical protein